MSKEDETLKWPWSFSPKYIIYGFNELDKFIYIKEHLHNELKVSIYPDCDFNEELNGDLIRQSPEMFNLLVELLDTNNLTEDQKKKILRIISTLRNGVIKVLKNLKKRSNNERTR